MDFNEGDKKISLSIKALLEPEKTEEKVEETGDVVSVDIDKVIAEQAAEEAKEAPAEAAPTEEAPTEE